MAELIDRRNSQHWAISPIVSAGAIVNWIAFVLTNRDTGREHQLQIPSGGIQVGVTQSGGSPSYTLFTTAQPVNFSDFDGVGARITSANLGVIYGYSIVWLTLWKSSAYVSDVLAYVKMSGGAFMFPGGGCVHGVTKVCYGSGSRMGDVPLRIVSPPEDFPRDPAWVKFKIIPKETSRVTLPNDILFGFNQDNLDKKAEVSLLRLADLLNNRTKLPVRIEGHTDAIGSREFNMGLGLRRAKAVRLWLEQHRVYGAANFEVKSLGEDKPVAPNRRPNGSDNPEGRALNRRVEIVFSAPAA